MIIKLANELEKEANVLTKNWQRMKNVGANKTLRDQAKGNVSTLKDDATRLWGERASLNARAMNSGNQYGKNSSVHQADMRALNNHKKNSGLNEAFGKLQHAEGELESLSRDVRIGQGLRVGAGVGGAAAIGGTAVGVKKMREGGGTTNDY